VRFQGAVPPTSGGDVFVSCSGLTNIYIPSCQYLEGYRAIVGSDYQDKITASEHGGFTYTAAGSVVTQTCTCGSVSATAELSIREGADLDYTGSAVTPVQVTYSNDWVEQDDNKPDETSIRNRYGQVDDRRGNGADFLYNRGQNGARQTRTAKRRDPACGLDERTGQNPAETV
jgi:hypothetical protein